MRSETRNSPTFQKQNLLYCKKKSLPLTVFSLKFDVSKKKIKQERAKKTECLTSSNPVWFSVVPALVVILNHIQTRWLQKHTSSGLNSCITDKQDPHPFDLFHFFIYNNNNDNNDYIAIKIVKLFYAGDFAVYAGGSIYWYLGKKQAKF